MNQKQNKTVWLNLSLYLGLSLLVSGLLWVSDPQPGLMMAQSPLAQPPPAEASDTTPYGGQIIRDEVDILGVPRPPDPTPTRVPDDTPPVTNLVITGPDSHQNWYRTPITLTFTATDNLVGLGQTWYRFTDEIQWYSYVYYSPPVVIDQEGQRNMYYYSEDSNNNYETPHTTPLNLDMTAPTATHTISGTLGQAGAYTSPVTITVTGTDSLSGLDYVEINLNNTGWLVGNTITVKQAGSHNLAYRAVDLADNVSLTHTVSFSLNEYLIWEAENTDTVINRNNQTWSTLSYLTDYSGSGYLKVEPDRDELYNSSGLATAPEVQYNLTLPITGTYTLWLRGAGANGMGDSVYASLVETGQTPYDKATISGFPPRQWGWNNRTLDGVSATISVAVPGDYTLYIWPREDGVSLDRILLTTEGNATPADLDIN